MEQINAGNCIMRLSSAAALLFADLRITLILLPWLIDAWKNAQVTKTGLLRQPGFCG
ncbi:MAG: hypothetical protein SPI81_05040 [Candidatus Faecousia sp.]|nr:hypothetical protein [Candidatus Faecousia sp.]